MQYELFSDADFHQELPFEGRSFCLLGTFRTASKTLKQKLQALGGEVRQGLSRNLHYVVMGNDVPADTDEKLQGLARHGYVPRVLTENDLQSILAGHYSSYIVPLQIKKDLHLSYRQFLETRLHYEGRLNPLYTKELYLAPDVSADLYQMLGNRGIYANAYIDDTTDVLVISDDSLRRLQDGQTDESLRHIESSYNQSRAQTFRFSMTSESELRSFLDNV